MRLLRTALVLCLIAFAAAARAQSGPFFSVDTTDMRTLSEEEIDNAMRDMGLRVDSDSVAHHPPRTHRDSLREALRRYRVGHEHPQAFDEWMPFTGFRYNKVDGLFLGLGSSRWGNFSRPVWRLSDDSVPLRDQWRGRGGLGYAFGSHFWTVELGLSHLVWLDHERGSATGIEIGAEGHIRTDSRDAWLLPVEENSAVALITHEDYMDYFKRKGFSAFAALHIGGEHLSVAYRNDDNRVLATRQYWSFFGGRKLFSENAPITEGTFRSVAVTSFFDNATSHRMYRGTQALLEGEFGLGDYPFRRYTLDLRHYQPLVRWFAVNGRVRAGAVTGDNVPLQNYFFVGGVSTVPAFDQKEFAGNRALIVNAEAIINGRLLDALLWFPRELSVIVMFDAGAASMADSSLGPTAGWEGIGIASMHSDAGIAVGSANGSVRIGCVWRGDRSEGAKFILRLSRPF